MPGHTDDKFWELKESAKWSLDLGERKAAVKQLAQLYGPAAFDSIAEIRDDSAFEEIRRACIEAIKHASANGRSVPLKNSQARRKVRKKRSQKKQRKKRSNSQ